MRHLLLHLFVISFLFQGYSCNLSSATMTNLQINPNGSCVITVQLCIGAGRTGSTLGGDGATHDLIFGFYSNGPLLITSFSPSLIQSDFIGCQMPGYSIGPLGGAPPYDTQETVYYDPSTDPMCSNGFTCVSSTAMCGNVAQDCNTFTFSLDNVPDSIRVFGVEGAGNPIGGCFPNADMGMQMSTWLNVERGELRATVVEEDNILVEWETHSEKENDFFSILRLMPEAHIWEPVGYVDGNGSTDQSHKYSFVDTYAPNGINYYRVQQTDFNGTITKSQVFSVAKDYNGYVERSIYPNPATDLIILKGLKKQEVTLLDDSGRILQTLNISENFSSLDISNLKRGIYTLRLVDVDNLVTYERIVVE